MKKRNRIILIILSIILILFVGGIILYFVLHSSNNLNNDEKKWLDTNSNKVLSIVIPNDIPVFGSTGAGVFFDFVDYLETNLNIKVNRNTVSYLSESSGLGFEVSQTFDNDKLLLFKDHYVLVSKNAGILYDDSTIPSLHAGILSRTSDLVVSYFNTSTESFVSYNSYTEITNALNDGTLSYALVPLNEYKDEILSNNINILSHISDLNHYYYLRLATDDIANSIIYKEFNAWKENEFGKSYNKNNYKLFIEKLNISEAEEATLTNRVYTYGFAENKPYEILSGGEYGGITAQYLRSFSAFSGVEFTYKKYKNATKLAEEAINGNIDLYYNYYNLITNYIDTGALGRIDYDIIAHNSIDLSLSNINGLQYRKVYVLKDSYLYDMIKDLDGIEISTYSSTSELKKLIKEKAIIVIDTNTYKYYVSKLTNNYSSRYTSTYTEANYTFRYKNDTDTFFKLFNAYTKTIDPSDLIRMGISTYNNVENKGNLFTNIAKYTLIIIIAGIVFYLIYLRKRRGPKINVKVKKNERIKYIDLLTSLKNRNFYNDRLISWNKNTIYPQACVVFDINDIKSLNDSYGHIEGDKQIQALANILVRNQIDNTEIIRMDGNEFLVYLVGYSEKQVLSYIKKISKGFKDLPYDSGVAIGFSLIYDDTKLVEDAYNEALIKMRENKGAYHNEEE